MVKIRAGFNRVNVMIQFVVTYSKSGKFYRIIVDDKP